jgi:hypothetical protein
MQKGMKSNAIILAAMLACGSTAFARANAADSLADSISGENSVHLWIKQSEKVGNVVQLFIRNRQRDTIILRSSFYLDDRKPSHVLTYCCGCSPNRDSTYCNWYSAPLEAEPFEYAEGKLRIPPGKTFYLEIPVRDEYIGHVVYLKPQLWFVTKDEKSLLHIVTKETNRIYLKRLSVLPRDSRHVFLFRHVYQNNNSYNRTFQRQVDSAYGKSEAIPLSYASRPYNEWINAWQLYTADSLEIAHGIFEKIQKANAGERIGSMALRKNGVYVGTFRVNNTVYPVAVYSEKDTVDNLTKVQVSTLDELEKPDNRRYLLYDRYYFDNYVIITFYEEGVSEPTLILQIEKPAERSRQSTVEEWLRFLNILQASESK